jgi:hypothetical protein
MASQNAGRLLQDFRLDWDREIATCPAGHPSQSWTVNPRQGRMVMRARFSRRHCHVCALKPRCTRSARRLLTLRPREEHAALEAARMRETQEAYTAQYRSRAGIEGTLSQAVRTMDLRRARYIGLAKVHLQHVLTAAALNLVRVAAWLAGTPLARTRHSAFVRLMAHPA